MKRPKFFCIVAHGMNLRPDRMSEIESVFQQLGGLTYRVVFKGHESNDVQSFNNATPEDWLSDFRRAYDEYLRFNLDIPLYFYGYSLGGLVGVSFLQSNTDISHQLKGMILTAPAIAPRKPLVWVAEKWGYPDWNYPSLNLPKYRVHKSTSLSVNNQIYSLIQKLKPVDVPTLIFSNPKDELISHNGTLYFIKKHQLKNWRVVNLEPTRKLFSLIPQHLIIDEYTVGRKTWQSKVETIQKFLNCNF